MITLKKYLIRSFTDEEAKPVYEIEVPMFAIFTNRLKVLEDGIYAFYSVDDTDDDVRKDRFVILKMNEDQIPKRSELIDILDVIVQVEGGKHSIMLLPVFKLKNDI